MPRPERRLGASRPLLAGRGSGCRWTYLQELWLPRRCWAASSLSGTIMQPVVPDGRLIDLVWQPRSAYARRYRGTGNRQAGGIPPEPLPPGQECPGRRRLAGLLDVVRCVDQSRTSPSIANLSFCIASRTLVFTVPSGCLSSSDISDWVYPSK